MTIPRGWGDQVTDLGSRRPGGATMMLEPTSRGAESSGDGDCAPESLILENEPLPVDG